MHKGLRKRLVTDEAVREVLLVSPHVYFPEDSPAQNDLYWDNSSEWAMGDSSSADAEASLSLFRVLDEMVEAMMNQDSFPKLTSVVLLGHSAGGMSIQRYALASALEARHGVTISYFVANPGSVAYPRSVRPNLVDRGGPCDTATLLAHKWTFAVPGHVDGCAFHEHYDDWPDGLGTHRQDTPTYILARPAEEMRLAYLERNVTYLSGSEDVCPCIESFDGTNCSTDRDCHIQGSCHMEVAHAFV